MSTPLMLRLLSASVAAATRAGNIIREVMSTGKLGIVDKGGNDPQTEADRKAQRCIVASLTKRFPGIRVEGEETLEPSDDDEKLVEMSDSEDVLRETCPDDYSSLQEKDVLVWVDPLDGTSEFTQGDVDHVTVLIGITISGKSVGGVIHQPYAHREATVGRTVWGLKGLGFRGINISPGPLKRGMGLHIAASKSHYTDLVDQTIKALNPAHVLRGGGCGNKILMVLEGKVDAYVFPSNGTKKWDTCGGEAIISAAGGMLTDIHGCQIDYTFVPDKYKNETGLLVTMDKDLLHGIVSKVPANVKAAFPRT